MGGSSGAVCSMAAGPVREVWVWVMVSRLAVVGLFALTGGGWVMLLRLGVVVAPPAPECDILRWLYRVKVAKGRWRRADTAGEECADDGGEECADAEEEE